MSHRGGGALKNQCRWLAKQRLRNTFVGCVVVVVIVVVVVVTIQIVKAIKVEIVYAVA